MQNEFRALAKLGEANHPNIVRVYRNGVMDHTGLLPFYFIDMELCVCTLAEYIYEMGSFALSPRFQVLIKQGSLQSLDFRVLWGILRDISSGLSFIHSMREVHRDLKPSNGKPCWEIC